MPKGQQKSNRETKKPKKTVAEKSKPSTAAGIPPAAGARTPPKKS